jgi:hypothetical protein
VQGGEQLGLPVQLMSKVPNWYHLDFIGVHFRAGLSELAVEYSRKINGQISKTAQLTSKNINKDQVKGRVEVAEGTIKIHCTPRPDRGGR